MRIKNFDKARYLVKHYITCEEEYNKFINELESENVLVNALVVTFIKNL